MNAMQKELKIDPSEYSPEVDFNADTGILSIQGRSMPEDIGSFFNPISDWVHEYIDNACDLTEFRIFFEYYNSSTARRITEIIFDLEQLLEKGNKVKVVWSYKSDDQIMKENGEEISSVVELPFELKEVSSH